LAKNSVTYFMDGPYMNFYYKLTDRRT